jgi:hypothetical protein
MKKLAEQQMALETEQAPEASFQGVRSRTDSTEDEGSTHADGSPSVAKAEDGNGLRPSLRASLCAAKLLIAIGADKGTRRVSEERRPSDPGQSAFAQQIELAAGGHLRRQSSFGSSGSGGDSRRPSNAAGGPSRARKQASVQDVLAQLQKSKQRSKEEEEGESPTHQESKESNDSRPCPSDTAAIAAAAVAQVESAKKRPSMTTLVRNLGSSTRVAPSPMRVPMAPEPSLCDRVGVRRHSVF